MLASRRSFFTGAAAFLAAPAIVRVGSLMPVRVPWDPFTRLTTITPVWGLSLAETLGLLRANMAVLDRIYWEHTRLANPACV